MTLQDAPEWAVSMLGDARVARLALLDEEDLPRVLPVTFAVWEGDVWSAIDQKRKRAPEPARVRRLRRRPDAALLVDRYDDDWDKLWWARADGVARILDDLDPAAMAALAGRYPRYRRPPPGPALGPMVEIAVERWSGWSAT